MQLQKTYNIVISEGSDVGEVFTRSFEEAQRFTARQRLKIPAGKKNSFPYTFGVYGPDDCSNSFGL